MMNQNYGFLKNVLDVFLATIPNPISTYQSSDMLIPKWELHFAILKNECEIFLCEKIKLGAHMVFLGAFTVLSIKF